MQGGTGWSDRSGAFQETEAAGGSLPAPVLVIQSERFQKCHSEQQEAIAEGVGKGKGTLSRERVLPERRVITCLSYTPVLLGTPDKFPKSHTMSTSDVDRQQDDITLSSPPAMTTLGHLGPC